MSENASVIEVDPEDPSSHYVVVPPDRLSAEILEALIEEFIMHEGANHGAEDTPMATKVAQVKAQLTKGSAVIVYHLVEEACRIVPASKGMPRL